MFIRRKKGGLFWLLIVLVVAIVYVIGTGDDTVQQPKKETKAVKDYTNVQFDDLVVRFVDVGQGDCEIIQLPDGTNIIIDGGPRSAEDELLEEIDSYGITRFDYVIATHPHEDHIGGLDGVIRKYDIGQVYLPKASSPSQVFEDFANAVKAKGITATRAASGVVMIDGEDVCAEFVAPVRDSYDETNDYSAVLKLTYYGFSMLFTGDAESLAEWDMINSGADLDADVLKVGHHGSTTSTSSRFLEEVSPDYAVIEVGEGNSYGHPHTDILHSLEGIPIYRTDLHGTVTFVYGKNGVNISTER